MARRPVAQAAHYDARRALIVISLEGGCEFSFPTELAEGLTDTPRSKLKKIEISPNGLGLHWPQLDADLYVPALIKGAFGVDGCNISAGSAAQRGVRPKPKHHARMERAAAAPRIKRLHSSPRPVAVIGDSPLQR